MHIKPGKAKIEKKVVESCIYSMRVVKFWASTSNGLGEGGGEIPS